MRIGIDARFYGKLGKGLGRYTQQLVKHLEMIDDRNEYVVFLRRENFDEYTPFRSNFTKVLADIPWYGWREQIELPILLRKQRLDLIHFPHFNVPIFAQTPFVVTVHDLILLRHPTHEASTLPKWLYQLKFFVYRRVLTRCLRRAKHIFTVSNFSKRDLLSHFLFLDKKDITVTYQANFSVGEKKNKNSEMKSGVWKIESEKMRFEFNKPYLLYAGNAYPHKNLSRLIRAFLLLHRDDSVLVLVGKKDSFYEKVRKEFLNAEQAGKVYFLGEVSDDDLDILYRGARGYVFVSLFEGCGLPPLEAMARGIPVMSSDTTSMPEILGDAPIYCNPESEESIASALRTLLDDEIIRKQCIKRGYDRASRYSWERLAEKTFAVYSRAINEEKMKRK